MSNRNKKRNQTLMNWTLIIVLVASVGIIIWASTGANLSKSKAFDLSVFELDRQPSLGSDDAPVTVVEFANYKCGSCAIVDALVVPQLVQDFVDTGDVKYYFINFSSFMGDDARTAAIAAEAVYRLNADEFWKFSQALFERQQEYFSEDYLVALAEELQLDFDYEQFRQALQQDDIIGEVDADDAIVSAVEIKSTPTFFINGVQASDSMDYNSLKKEIEKAKSKAAK